MATSSTKNQKKRSNAKVKKASRKMAFLLTLITCLRPLYDWFVDFIFSFIYDNSKKIILPPVDETFLQDGAVVLADKIRTKQLSSEKVVKACIERIRQVNRHLNCIVEDRFELALKEAKETDEFIANTDLSSEELKKQKPFLGVPFTSKESTSSKGMNFTCGLVSRKGVTATEDADIVKHVKSGGGILIGVTNIPELNMWSESRNNVYGQTNNPYDLNRTVGGSSGGEAAAVSACASPMGIGTDIGGSTRMPAFFCGVFGHKPTTGLISTKGMTFRLGEEKSFMVTAGTITRSAEDIIPFFKLLLADNVSQLKLDTKVNLKDVKVFYTLEPGDARVSPVSAETKKMINRSVNHLNQSGINGEPQKLNLSGFKYSYTLWRYWMSKEPVNFALDLGNGESEVKLMTELPKMLIGQCQYTLSSILRLVESEILPAVPAEWAEEETAKLRKELLDNLGDNGVLLFPSHPTTAHRHYTAFFRPYNFAYWAVINVLRLPSTQVPLGLSEDGLPIGLQVISAPYNDHLCIAVAQELERAFGGWVPPYTQPLKK